MLKAEIKRTLSQYKNVLELINHANELKRAGESEIMVNRVVAELRKEMLNATSDIKRLPRRAIHETPMDVVGLIPFDVDNLLAPMIVWDGTNVLI